MRITVKPYTPDFKSGILLLNRLALHTATPYWKEWHEKKGKDWSASWDKDLKEVETKYLGNGGAFILLFVNGWLAGMGGLYKIDETCAKIKRIRIHPEYQRMGLSMQIMAELEKKAKELGYKKLITDTVKGNVPAEKMILKAGFGNPHEASFSGVPCTLFEKELSL